MDLLSTMRTNILPSGTLKLLKPEKYHYLNQSGCIEIENVNDGEAFGDLKIAMTVLGITIETQDSIFRVLSAVLLLGNVEFKSDGKDGCVVTNPADLASVAELLGVDTARLTTTLTVRNMKVLYSIWSYSKTQAKIKSR
jgi:myosin heavy subunit